MGKSLESIQKLRDSSRSNSNSKADYHTLKTDESASTLLTIKKHNTLMKYLKDSVRLTDRKLNVKVTNQSRNKSNSTAQT